MVNYLVLGAQATSLGDTIFYLTSFIILVLLIKHYAWGPVTKNMDKRSKKISDDLDYADSERDRAEKLAKQREDELKNSKNEAVKIVADAKESGNNQKQKIIDDANEEADQRKKKADNEIEQNKKEALSNAKNDISSISVEIASKIIKKDLNEDDQKELVDSYIKELSADGKEK